MTGFLGMNTAAAHQFGQDAGQAARTLEDLSKHVEQSLSSARWIGADADAFREVWRCQVAARIAGVCARLTVLGATVEAQAQAQDAVSGAVDGHWTGASPIPAGASSNRTHTSPIPTHASSIPAAQSSGRVNNPLIPDGIESPLDDVANLSAITTSVLAHRARQDLDHLLGVNLERSWARTIHAGSDGIGLVADSGVAWAHSVGLGSDALDQAHRDGEHFRSVLTDIATGDRAPTVTEVVASGTVATASVAGAIASLGGIRTSLFNDRPGGKVSCVRTDTAPHHSAQNLADLVRANDALRVPDEAPAGSPGHIQIQRIESSAHTRPVYIVQIPPTEGHGITDARSWGTQENSRDWASNLRLAAGEHSAAMDDVLAAMRHPDEHGQPLVPDGAEVLFVGHSQGGLIGARLAADPAVNATSGAPGTYRVTHSFSVGSPVQTVTPALADTEIVNVAHQLGDLTSDGSLSGDPIPYLDLQGLRFDGTHLNHPHVHEVELPGYRDAPSSKYLVDNHDSIPRDSAGNPEKKGYYRSVEAHTGSDPTLSALQRDLTGRYIGSGTVVTRDSVVTVGRGQP
ncbi:WXG100 family type VII secretion target [Devriesea agamarum]|uniref:WXG100 family type VII secretion target n=1 Tax=Devriesea agamarum TaxID=472569 RepID=UPI00071DA8EB|nr:hypothetical protein [Devriesea agamarum]